MLQFKTAMAELQMLLAEFPDEAGSAPMLRLQQHLEQLLIENKGAANAAAPPPHCPARAFRGMRIRLLLACACSAALW